MAEDGLELVVPGAGVLAILLVPALLVPAPLVPVIDAVSAGEPVCTITEGVDAV